MAIPKTIDSIQYNTTFTSEISEENGRKIILISGTLMNDKMNANYWILPAEELNSIATQFKGHPIKLQHANSDWEIIGSGVSAFVDGTDVKYIAKITDSKAVDKFESCTWTADNMGISPSVQPTSIECSICGKDPQVYGEDSCNHYIGEKYEDEVAGIITHGNKLIESSLTSRPAYESVGAGSIEEANIQMMIASIQKITKTEEKRMAEKTEIEAKVAELTTLKAELETSKAELKASKEEMVSFKEEVESLKASIKKAEEDKNKDDKEDKESAELIAAKEEIAQLKEKVAGYEDTARTAELIKLVADKDFVAEIIAKRLSEEDFTAEIAKIKKITELSAAKVTTETNGSAPTEGSPATDKDSFKEIFGASKEEMTKNIFGNLVKE